MLVEPNDKYIDLWHRESSINTKESGKENMGDYFQWCEYQEKYFIEFKKNTPEVNPALFWSGLMFTHASCLCKMNILHMDYHPIRLQYALKRYDDIIMEALK